MSSERPDLGRQPDAGTRRRGDAARGHKGMFRVKIRLFIYLALTLSLSGQTPAQRNADVQEFAARLAKAHRAWGPALNSPNVSLSVREIPVPGAGHAIKYRVHAIGLPADSEYALLTWPITQPDPIEASGAVTLDDTGLVICAGTEGACGTPEKPNDPVDFVLSPVRGEPFRVALISLDDESIKAFLKVVPIPNASRDKECVLDSVLLMPGGAAVAIEGAGFEPGAEVTMETRSGSEHYTEKAKAGADGKYFSVILPYRKGEQRGTTNVNLKSAQCSPALSFDWGR